MILKLWNWYQHCSDVHPIKTQVISSGLLWGVGDIAAQSISQFTPKRRLQLSAAGEDFRIDWRRVGITSVFGFSFVGPIGHFWYEGLDKFIRFKFQMKSNSARFVATKVAMDSLIFGPFHLLVFLTYMGFATGKNPSHVKETLKRDFFPALLLEGSTWPIVQAANFRYVPVQYQLLYVNAFCLIDSAFLSWFEQQKDASWKKWFTSLLSSKLGILQLIQKSLFSTRLRACLCPHTQTHTYISRSYRHGWH